MLIDDLANKGWFYQDNFFDPIFCSELLEEARHLDWKQAKVGKGTQKQEALSIRNDSIFWIDDSLATPLQQNYLKKMNDLMQSLNKELFLGLREFECHFARYDAYGFYKKHLDQHQGTQARVISTVLYLNSPSKGGELAIYSRENPEQIEMTIAPKAGTFVCFLSNQIYHEVLATEGERFSLTGWFRTL